MSLTNSEEVTNLFNRMRGMYFQPFGFFIFNMEVFS